MGKKYSMAEAYVKVHPEFSERVSLRVDSILDFMKFFNNKILMTNNQAVISSSVYDFMKFRDNFNIRDIRGISLGFIDDNYDSHKYRLVFHIISGDKYFDFSDYKVYDFWFDLLGEVKKTWEEEKHRVENLENDFKASYSSIADFAFKLTSEASPSELRIIFDLLSDIEGKLK